jgi:hypothetical protein
MVIGQSTSEQRIYVTTSVIGQETSEPYVTTVTICQTTGEHPKKSLTVCMDDSATYSFGRVCPLLVCIYMRYSLCYVLQLNRYLQIERKMVYILETVAIYMYVKVIVHCNCPWNLRILHN